ARAAAPSCLRSLRALDSDATTDVIVLISKPPAARVREDVTGLTERLSKPVGAILLGERPPAPAEGNVHYAHTLDEAARIAVELAGTRASRPVALQPVPQVIQRLSHSRH